MDPASTQPAASNPSATAYLWEAPGKPFSVYLDFDVVDRLSFEVMRGYGQVPKRGAEVGGLLLGTAEQGERTVVRIEDFVSVPCEYVRGPSYILSEADQALFDDTLAKWGPGPDRRISVIGYFRSNTRDEVRLSAEDTALLDTRFPSPSAVVLMIKPYATRVSEATFFFRDNGVLRPEAANPLFPFRRKELGGGVTGRRRGGEPGTPPAEAPLPAAGLAPEAPPPEFPLAAPTFGMPPLEPAPDLLGPEPARHRFRGGWVWIPLSFIFLLLGVVLGFQIAMSFRGARNLDAGAGPYHLELSVASLGDRVHLKWNPDSRPMRDALRGLLTIEDGDNRSTKPLSADDLRRGGAIYRNYSPQVEFRLEVWTSERVSVSERLSLRAREGDGAATRE